MGARPLMVRRFQLLSLAFVTLLALLRFQRRAARR